MDLTRRDCLSQKRISRSDWIFWLKIQARRDDETFLTQPEKAVASVATVANSRLRRLRRLTIFITVISPTGKSGRGPGGSRESNGVARQGNREHAGTRPGLLFVSHHLPNNHQGIPVNRRSRSLGQRFTLEQRRKDRNLGLSDQEGLSQSEIQDPTRFLDRLEGGWMMLRRRGF